MEKPLAVIDRSARKETASNDGLSKQELERYSRHMLIPDVGLAGQERLKRSKALVVGLGGLGSPVSMYLAAAGVGTLGLVENDVVDETNLQRQLLYSTQEIGRSKIERAGRRLSGINPNVRIVEHETRLTSANALDIIADYDVVVDGTDNFPTRYLVNDACVMLSKPNVYGSIYRFEGQVSVFWAEKGPCYRCLYPRPPPPGLVPSCAEGGVLGVLPGVVGSMQANEAIKVLLGIGTPLVGRLLLYDAFEMTFTALKVKKASDCVVCGPEPSVTRLIDYEQFCGIEPTMRTSNPTNGSEDVAAIQLKAWIDGNQPHFLLDVREPMEAEICAIEPSVNVPMNDVPGNLASLPRDRDIVVYCRTGQRSAQVAAFLRSQGFPRVHNLAGGIHAWIDDVDPTLAKY